MAANLDKAESSLTTVSDLSYIRGIDSSGNSVKISKSDLASVLGVAWTVDTLVAYGAITIPLGRSCIIEMTIIGEKYAKYSFNWDNGHNPTCALIESTEDFTTTVASVTASLSGLSVTSLMGYSTSIKWHVLQ